MKHSNLNTAACAACVLTLLTYAAWPATWAGGEGREGRGEQLAQALQPVDSSIGMCLGQPLDPANPQRYVRKELPFGEIYKPTMCKVVIDTWHRAHSDGCVVRMSCGQET